MPSPVSETDSSAAESSTFTPMVTVPPWVCRTAFDTRLTRIWMTLSRSTNTGGAEELRRTSMVLPVCAHTDP